jgi:hypothetical protein
MLLPSSTWAPEKEEPLFEHVDDVSVASLLYDGGGDIGCASFHTPAFIA